MRNFENAQKIKRISGILKAVAGLAMAWAVLEGVYFVVSATHLVDTMDSSSSSAVSIMSALGCIIDFMVGWNFWAFFSRLKQGHMFDAPTVARLMTAGKWKLASWLYRLITGALAIILLAEPASDFFWKPFIQFVVYGTMELGGLTTALMIILAAWLLREGQTLEEEQELTV